MLTKEDSKRVADALIAKIEDIDINSAVLDAISSVLMPQTQNRWKRDWFPLSIEHMFDEISSGVVAAAHQAAEKKRR